jgi:hypothetical protein
VIFAKCERDQPLGDWIGQEARHVGVVLGCEDPEACQERPASDEAGA